MADKTLVRVTSPSGLHIEGIKYPLGAVLEATDRNAGVLANGLTHGYLEVVEYFKPARKPKADSLGPAPAATPPVAEVK